MTVDELERDWREYLIDINVYLVHKKKTIKERLILKQRFFTCFKEDEEAITFVSLDKDLDSYTYKCDSENNCYLKIFDGAWIKIGKFIKIPAD